MRAIVQAEKGNSTIMKTQNESSPDQILDFSSRALEIASQNSLSDINIDDANVGIPMRLFKSLTELDEPLQPLPIDPLMYMEYDRGFESRCQICTSHWRERAEHVYIDCGRNAHKVVTFFANYFNARLSWNAIDTHMNYHCNLRKTSVRGLKLYEGFEEEASRFKYHELDLVLSILLVEIDTVKGIDTSRQPELKLKVAARLESMCDKLMRLQRERDEQGTASLNIFEILKSLYDTLNCEADRIVLKNKVHELRERLASN